MAYEHRTDAERSRQAKLAELTPLADRKLLLKTCIHTAGKMLANQRTSLNEVRDARETDAAEIARRARVEDDVAFDATRVRFVSAERALLQALDYRLFMATPHLYLYHHLTLALPLFYSKPLPGTPPAKKMRAISPTDVLTASLDPEIDPEIGPADSLVATAPDAPAAAASPAAPSPFEQLAEPPAMYRIDADSSLWLPPEELQLEASCYAFLDLALALELPRPYEHSPSTLSAASVLCTLRLMLSSKLAGREPATPACAPAAPPARPVASVPAGAASASGAGESCVVGPPLPVITAFVPETTSRPRVRREGGKRKAPSPACAPRSPPSAQTELDPSAPEGVLGRLWESLAAKCDGGVAGLRRCVDAMLLAHNTAQNAKQNRRAAAMGMGGGGRSHGADEKKRVASPPKPRRKPLSPPYPFGLTRYAEPAAAPLHPTALEMDDLLCDEPPLGEMTGDESDDSDESGESDEC